MTTLMRWAVSAAFLTCGLALTHAQGQNDWPTVGNDPGGMKFSKLSQITAENVAKLQKAWTYDLGPVPGGRGYGITPLVIDNVMYLPKGGSSILALNATTGTELWVFDLKNER